MPERILQPVWTPDDARALRDYARHALVLVAFAAMMIAAAVTGTAIAKADGIIDPNEPAYIQKYGAGAVCATIDEYPTYTGVIGVMRGIMKDGFADDSAVDIINESVLEYCPSHWQLLVDIGNQARGDGPLKRAV